jgi:hypothetical protein
MTWRAISGRPSQKDAARRRREEAAAAAEEAGENADSDEDAEDDDESDDEDGEGSEEEEEEKEEDFKTFAQAGPDSYCSPAAPPHLLLLDTLCARCLGPGRYCLLLPLLLLPFLLLLLRPGRYCLPSHKTHPQQPQ